MGCMQLGAYGTGILWGAGLVGLCGTALGALPLELWTLP